MKVIGNFTVHKEGETYTVTHAPSGKAAYHGIARQRDAIVLATAFAGIAEDTSAPALSTPTLQALILALRDWKNGQLAALSGRR